LLFYVNLYDNINPANCQMVDVAATKIREGIM